MSYPKKGQRKLVTSAAVGGISLPLLLAVPHNGGVGLAISAALGLGTFLFYEEVAEWSKKDGVDPIQKDVTLPATRAVSPEKGSWFDRVVYGKERAIENEKKRRADSNQEDREASDEEIAAYLRSNGINEEVITAFLEQQQKSEPSVVTGHMGDNPSLRLILSENFQPDINMVLREGCLACGIKGSGKTGVMARIIEQIIKVARQATGQGIPLVVFDKEGDLLSLLEIFPNGRVIDAEHWYRAEEIITGRLQVIVSLHAWLKSEDKAARIASLVFDLIEYTSHLPIEQCVPCPVFLDEGQFWLPQDSVSYMGKDTRMALLDAFDVLLNAGRKRGLTPFIFTQRMAQINKDVCSTGIQIFMRQILDNDHRRCMDYIRAGILADKKDLSTFAAGQGVVCLPRGVQLLVQFKERETLHLSHAPTVDRVVQAEAGSASSSERRAQKSSTLTLETITAWFDTGKINDQQYFALLSQLRGDEEPETEELEDPDRDDNPTTITRYA